uniref:NHR domain-containing protein n=1 Tax=Knipowitschia caucasica TaxID=637954 RepID=A0AAV2JN08_KNICA
MTPGEQRRPLAPAATLVSRELVWFQRINNYNSDFGIVQAETRVYNRVRVDHACAPVRRGRTHGGVDTGGEARTSAGAMGGHITRNSLYDSMSGPFPSTTHRCHHKPKRWPALPQCGLSSFPLQFHPSTKGSQILMDLSHRTVKRQSSFCNAITFSNRPIAVYEQVRLKITKKQCCWSGALRLGFTSKDPSRIRPDSLPKYACPDLVSQSGFWAKALPEELSDEGTVLSFWVDKKGRVFYRVNQSPAMLFFSGVHMAEPLWALIDVYGLTRGVQLLAHQDGVVHLALDRPPQHAVQFG